MHPTGHSAYLLLLGIHAQEVVAEQTLSLFNSQDVSPTHSPVKFGNTTSARLRQLRRDVQRWSGAESSGRVFAPGRYVYGFELLLDSRCPETIHLEWARVHYALHVIVERSGLWSDDVKKSRDVNVVRHPSVNALDTTGAVRTTRAGRPECRYNIVVCTEAAALGDWLPLSISLIPMSNAGCFQMTIYLNEKVHYRRRNEGSYSQEGRNHCKRVMVFSGEEQGGYTHGPSRDEHPPGGDISSLSTADDRAIVRSTRRTERQPNRKALDAVNLDVELPLPPCRKHASDDLLQMHCDTDYKNVRVSHSLEVRTYATINKKI